MHISSGFARGMKLKSPSGLATRPTSAKLRMALLNSLQEDIPGASILDLYAGSGALGLEAISRGAIDAVLVDQNREAQECLNENIQEIKRRAEKQGLETVKIVAYKAEVESWLKSNRPTGKIDLVFADPPYKEAEGSLLLLLEYLPQLMANGGKFCFEAGSDIAPALLAMIKESDRWNILKEKSYGQSQLLILSYVIE